MKHGWHNSMLVSGIWHLYTLQNDYHDKSSNYLSPHKVTAILSTVFPMLYITSSRLTCSTTGRSELLIPFTCSIRPPTYPPTRLPAGKDQFVLWVYESVSFCLVICFVLFILDSSYIWNNMVFVFLYPTCDFT